MNRKIALIICLGAMLALSACDSGHKSTGLAPGEDEAARLERKAEHIEGLLARRTMTGDVLAEVIEALPNRVRLVETAFKSGEIQVKGSAPSNNLVADLIARLDVSPSFANVALRSSSMKIVNGREAWEFALEAVARESAAAFAREVGEERAAAAGGPAARLERLEKSLPARQASADMLREIQRLVLDSGLQMTKYAPGSEVAGEFTIELPVTIEVQGDLDEFNDFVRGLAALPSLWLVDRFSLKVVAPSDARSQVRASIACLAVSSI